MRGNCWENIIVHLCMKYVYCVVLFMLNTIMRWWYNGYIAWHVWIIFTPNERWLIPDLAVGTWITKAAPAKPKACLLKNKRFMMTSSNGDIFRVSGHLCSPVNSPHKGQWRGALVFALICVWINGWVNNHEAGDLRRYSAHYDVTVMLLHYAWWTPKNEISGMETIFINLWYILFENSMGASHDESSTVYIYTINILQIFYGGHATAFLIKWKFSKKEEKCKHSCVSSI